MSNFDKNLLNLFFLSTCLLSFTSMNGESDRICLDDGETSLDDSVDDSALILALFRYFLENTKYFVDSYSPK